MDPTEILSRLGTDQPPTDAELAEAYAEFGAQLADALDRRNRDEARNLNAARAVIREEQSRRDEARAAEDRELAELAAGLDEPHTEPDEDTDDETDEDATDAEPEVLDLAAIRAASRNAKASLEAKAEPVNPYPHLKVTTRGAAVSERVDHTTTLDDLAHIFAEHARGRDPGKHTLFSMIWDLPESRRLNKEADKSTAVINEVLRGATSFEAIAASAVCGPLGAEYSIPQLGSTVRPVRDTAMVRFGGERGGISFNPAPRLSTSGMSSAVSVWPDGDSPGDKPCLHVDCECIDSQTVEAITACLTVGNFLARFSPEQWAAALHQLAVAHARLGENYLLSRIDAQSVATTTLTHPGGTIPGIMDAVGRGITAIRSRDRRLEDTAFRVILEGFARNAMRAHFGTQNAAGNPSAIAIADQAINAWFANYGATVTWTWDDTVFGAQNPTPGALVAYPATTNVRVYPEGTWGFIDGGTLDLGTEIIDLDLVKANERAAFMETFEGALKRTAANPGQPCGGLGDDSLLIPVTVDQTDCINACYAAG